MTDIFYSEGEAKAPPRWVAEVSVIMRESGLDFSADPEARLSRHVTCRVVHGLPAVNAGLRRPFSWLVFSRRPGAEAASGRLLAELVAEADAHAPGGSPISVIVSEAERTALEREPDGERMVKSAPTPSSTGRQSPVQLHVLAEVLGQLIERPQLFERLVVSPACLETLDGLIHALARGLVGTLERSRRGWTVLAPASEDAAAAAGFVNAALHAAGLQALDASAERLHKALNRALTMLHRPPELGESPCTPSVPVLLKTWRAELISASDTSADRDQRRKGEQAA